tara:strand:- start:252 stop:476 length:225 start_codon:yes stop_codon:yes gene_type:complete
MALTAEQQSQIDYETARKALDDAENNQRNKLDAVRMAQSIINENRRLTSAADATDVTVAQITAMADEIITYINS